MSVQDRLVSEDPVTVHTGRGTTKGQCIRLMNRITETLIKVEGMYRWHAIEDSGFSNIEDLLEYIWIFY